MIKLRVLVVACDGRMESTTRTSWMANNAIPDSIMTNMTCRNLVPVVPKTRSTEVLLVAALTCKNTLRILNTIKPVIRAFTTMDTVKAVTVNAAPQIEVNIPPCTNVIAACDTSQETRDDKLRSASIYQKRQIG